MSGRAFMGLAVAMIMAMAAPALARPACDGARIRAERQSLWVKREGSGRATIIFESGNGNDSTVWKGLLEPVRAMGASTFIYDRAGLGQSAARQGEYDIRREVGALRKALTICGVRAPVILVAHSYGGIMALLTASQDRRVAGLVLVDALVPETFTDEEIAATLAEVRPQYAEVQKEAPELAASIIPLMEAMPQTAGHVRPIRLRKGLPVIDIVAGKADYTRPAARDLHFAGHAAFVAHDAARKSVLAESSGHKVMFDQPDLVLDAIRTLVGPMNREK